MSGDSKRGPAEDTGKQTGNDPASGEPSDVARRRAQEAGIDLESLRRTDPERFAMLGAEEAIRTDQRLAGHMAQVMAIVFSDARIFRLDAGSQARFLVFPAPSEPDLERLEDAAARLATATSIPHAMFRVVHDMRGERRELLVPVAADAWDGSDGVVGPFATERAAEAWSDRNVQDPLVADTFSQDGAWFVDVFSGDESMVRAGG